jgi:hypothetical protein
MNEHEFKSQRRSSFTKQHTYANIHLQRVEAANQASADEVHRIKVTIATPPVFDFRAFLLLSLCAYGNARFRLQTPGQRPGGPKAISYQLATDGGSMQ